MPVKQISAQVFDELGRLFLTHCRNLTSCLLNCFLSKHFLFAMLYFGSIDWIKSSSDVNSDSSFSMSPLPPSPLDSDIMVTEEVLEDSPSPINTVTVGSDEIILSSIHKTLEQASIELHNYSSNFSQDPHVKVKSYNKSNTVSPTSSTGSSPNVRKSGGRGARGKPITELTLSEEEKRLLSKEGYADFPSGSIPLTKQEEKVLRKVRRKIRNKRSAQCSRQRKKEYVDELEKKYEKCANDNDSLRREVMKLRKENSSLMLKMKNFVGGTGQTSLKTSFFVLILSFLLVLVPFFRYVSEIILASLENCVNTFQMHE